MNEGRTNPLCRAAFLEKNNIAAILLKYGARVDIQSADGNTALHWAAHKQNLKMVEFLLHSEAPLDIVNNKGFTVLDISVNRMNYEAALFFKMKGIEVKDADYYRENLFRPFDIDLFIDMLKDNKSPPASWQIFLEKLKKEEAAWLARDLVPDVRENWNAWFNRQLNFELPPLVPREELPEEKQPHKSVYGKVTCFLNGYNAYPEDYNEKGEPKVIPGTENPHTQDLNEVDDEEEECDEEQLGSPHSPKEKKIIPKPEMAEDEEQ